MSFVKRSRIRLIFALCVVVFLSVPTAWFYDIVRQRALERDAIERLSSRGIEIQTIDPVWLPTWVEDRLPPSILRLPCKCCWMEEKERTEIEADITALKNLRTVVLHGTCWLKGYQQDEFLDRANGNEPLDSNYGGQYEGELWLRRLREANPNLHFTDISMSR